MALELTKNVKGYDYSYWRIRQLRLNFDRGITRVLLALYKDRSTRLENIQSDVRDEQKAFVFNELLTRADAYAKIKESKIADKTDVLQGLAEKEGEEMNEFANAKDIIE